MIKVDVLSVGHACYDLVFALDHHPDADEKTFANEFEQCGGGPAANAAVAVARLGHASAFCGYLGNDVYGDLHLQELKTEGVDTSCLVRGKNPTPLAAVMVEPDTRAVVNSSGNRELLQSAQINLSRCFPKVILLDGLEPDISEKVIDLARSAHIPTVLDAGSLHAGTQYLMDKVDYLVASQVFAEGYTGGKDPDYILEKLSESCSHVIVTLGRRGLVWMKQGEKGALPAFDVKSVDTTGAGDAFHGAFAAGLSVKMAWDELLRFSSAVAALTCTRLGARHSLPTIREVKKFLRTVTYVNS